MLAERLKKLRNDKDVFQKDVASYLGITTSAYGFYEQGERTPDPETLQKLADYFECSVDYLLGRSSIRNPNKGPEEIDLLAENVQFYLGGQALTEKEMEDIRHDLLLIREVRRKYLEEQQEKHKK